MPATGRVSVNYQMLFAILPFLCIFAAYRIKKLRRYLAIVIIVAIGFGILDGIVEFSDLVLKIIGITLIIFEVYLIRQWSIHWNYKIDVESDTHHM